MKCLNCQTELPANANLYMACRSHGKERHCEVTLTSKPPPLWTLLQLAGLDARFLENYFHLLPAKAVSITISTDKGLSVAELRKCLRVQSLINTYR